MLELTQDKSAPATKSKVSARRYPLRIASSWDIPHAYGGVFTEFEEFTRNHKSRRSAARFLKLLCKAFKNSPPVCDQTPARNACATRSPETRVDVPFAFRVVWCDQFDQRLLRNDFVHLIEEFALAGFLNAQAQFKACLLHESRVHIAAYTRHTGAKRLQCFPQCIELLQRAESQRFSERRFFEAKITGCYQFITLK